MNNLIPDAQKEIIQAPISERLLVYAGPGTGKTFCLINRLKNIASQVMGDQDILVLSFSVAVVQEIRNRLIAEGGVLSLERIHIRTFDSFASWFMGLLGKGEEIASLDYDDRIQKTLETIKNHKEACDHLSTVAHILVDEIQDLSGNRAALVLELLNVCKSGFTLLGDPAQAIYDDFNNEYEQISAENKLSSTDFLERVKEKFKHTLKPHYDLKENHRVSSDNIEILNISKNIRKLIMTSQCNNANLANQISNVFHALAMCRIDTISPDTAVLCPTNGQAMSVAGDLTRQGIQVFLQRRRDEIVYPSWLGWLFLGYEKTEINKDQFIAIAKERLPTTATDWEVVWNNLKDDMHSRSSSGINILRLRECIKNGDLDFEYMLSDKKEKVVISTIHRAKGREYNNVAILADEYWLNRISVKPMDGKVAFVALTRARERLYRFPSLGVKGMKLAEDKTRWICEFKGRITHIAVGLSGDLDDCSFASGFNDATLEDILCRQNKITHEVNGRSRVTLVLNRSPSDFSKYGVYVAISEGRQMLAGFTSSKLSESIKRILGHNNLPERISGLFINDIISVVGDYGREDVPRKLRTTALWCGLDIQGLGCLEF